MSNNFPGQQSKLPAMDNSIVGDSSFPQVSNLLRRLAASSNQQQQSQILSSKLGMSPLSLRERILSADAGGGGSSLSGTESRSSSGISIPFDPDLQSLWELGAQQQQQQQQQQQYESSPLNPNHNTDSQSLRQMHLRQQLGAMAAALLPRAGSLPPTDSQGSGENRAAQKRRWADCLGETSSHPSSHPSSPARPTGGDSLLPLALEGAAAGGGGGVSREEQQLILAANSGGEGPKVKEGSPGKDEWEPRVRRKKGRGGSSGGGAMVNTDDEGNASDDGVVRIKAKSMTERQRRDRISDALRRLRGVVNSHGDMATMLNEAVDVIQQQKRRIEELEMQILQQRLRQQLAGGCRTLF